MVKDDTEAAAKGRRQDLFTIQTLLGTTDSTTTTSQQREAANRKLYTGLHPVPALALRLLDGSLEPLDGWDIGDKAPVSIVNGIDNIEAAWRMVGAQGKYDEAGEHLSIMVAP